MSRELKEMRGCHPGEKHQGRRDNIAKAQRSEQVWPTDGKLLCARAEGLGFWKGGPQGLGGQARSQRALRDFSWSLPERGATGVSGARPLKGHSAAVLRQTAGK